MRGSLSAPTPSVDGEVTLERAPHVLERLSAPRPSTRNRPQANFIGALLLAAAYGFLNQPAPPQPVLREATIINAEEATFFDVGLDDASIPFDDGITAARKCGFCMG